MNYGDKDVVGYLIFKRVKINGANSISSPLTYGFPAITGFLGAFHAMSRKFNNRNSLKELFLGGVLIACHECKPHIYQPNNYSNYTFNLTRNPIKKDGKTASIIEEGKCNLEVTLVVEVLSDDMLAMDDENTPELIETMHKLIMQHRIAGGSVQQLDKFKPVDFIPHEDSKKIKPMLLPAFVLKDAQQDMAEITQVLQMKNPKATALDALLEVGSLHHVPEVDENNKTTWHVQSAKSGRGWLVPIPIGFQGISDTFDPGVMQNTRNPEYRSQYVETIYSLGKWLFPHRIKDLSQAFWHYHHDEENNLYLTKQNKGAKL